MLHCQQPYCTQAHKIQTKQEPRHGFFLKSTKKNLRVVKSLKATFSHWQADYKMCTKD